jgi:cellulose biosynthesis protein BcsQ
MKKVRVLFIFFILDYSRSFNILLEKNKRTFDFTKDVMSQDLVWYQYFKRQFLELIPVGKDADFIILDYSKSFNLLLRKKVKLQIL